MKMADLKIGDIAMITECPHTEYVGTVIAICQASHESKEGARAQIIGPKGGYNHSWHPLNNTIKVINITSSILEGVKNATK